MAGDFNAILRCDERQGGAVSLNVGCSKGEEGERPFRFLVSWLTDPEFQDVVTKSWRVKEKYNSSRLREREAELQFEIESILNQEELFWAQKSRCEWLYNGDCNTRFFHSRTLKRRK
ncbi:hypothetical protein Goarm_023343, partial [Gossypium armourianum]|nr:hypothetical protein [Gossypium armourianum]